MCVPLFTWTDLLPNISFLGITRFMCWTTKTCSNCGTGAIITWPSKKGRCILLSILNCAFRKFTKWRRLLEPKIDKIKATSIRETTGKKHPVRERFSEDVVLGWNNQKWRMLFFSLTLNNRRFVVIQTSEKSHLEHADRQLVSCKLFLFLESYRFCIAP